MNSGSSGSGGTGGTGKVRTEQHELVNLASMYLPSHSTMNADAEESTVYLRHRKTFELVRWCNFLSTRGKAERIDIVARGQL
ncbi:unnamed protein product [Enterobius vermicularis]|uniref:Uncharacterized protein n=1 Tax=Enterobius vermicularis TaxID=51028 RepID=A0A0N4VK82_ENTVE|nr:unnamed protein product [Enterobius vermicularis]